jgi:hypothetical protein
MITDFSHNQVDGEKQSLSMTGAKEESFSFTSEYVRPQIISFFNLENQVIGTIDFSGPELTFSGKADASAKVFFDALIAHNSAYIKGLQDEINSLKKEKQS